MTIKQHGLYCSKIVLAVVAGMVVTLIALQHHPAVHAYFLDKIKQVAQARGLNVNATIKKCSLLTPRITFHNITATAPGQDWHWSLEECTIATSWLDLARLALEHQQCSLSIQLNSLEAYSGLKNGKPVILDHLEQLLANSNNTAISLEMLAIHQAHLVINDPATVVDLHLSGALTQRNTTLYATCHLHDTAITHNSAHVKSLDGTLKIKAPLHNLAKTRIVFDGTTLLPTLPLKHPQFFISATAYNGTVTAHGKSLDGILTLNKITCKQTADGIALQGQAHIALDTLTIAPADTLKGTVTINVQGTFKENLSLTGNCIVEQAQLGPLALNNAHAEWQFDTTGLQGTLTADNLAQGTLAWDAKTDEAQAQLINTSPVNMGPIDIPAEQLTAEVTIHHLTSAPRLTSNIHATLLTQTNEQLPLNVQLHQQGNELQIIADIQGNNTQLPLGLTLQEALLKARFANNCLYCSGNITLNKGTLLCNEAIIQATALHYPTTWFVHAPITVHRVTVTDPAIGNITLSGHATFVQKNTAANLKGFCIVERGHIQPVNQQKPLNPPTPPAWYEACNLELHCLTKNPVSATTALLTTQAHAQLNITGTIQQPAINGAVTMLGGTIAFPYKSLHITQGNLHLLPNKPFDPLIELTAKNNIKQYGVTMHIDGSLQQPHISLSATPHLSEEQIGALLIAGSEHIALNIMVPSLIAQQVQALIGAAQPVMLDKYAKKLLPSLKHIRVVPHVTDSSGKQSLQGGIEIDVQDRLHALIQKDLQTPADETKIEVNYRISDDMEIRGIKDEHGDIGGEVEMRWRW